MAKINLKDLGKEVDLKESCLFKELLEFFSGKKAKKIIAFRCESGIYDLSRKIPEDCKEVEAIFLDTSEGLEILRHSAAHIMAEAVKKIFPTAKVTIGPAIEDGFYYDFDYERPFTPDDLEKIEKEMAKSIAANHPFIREEVSAEEAKKLFLKLNETYKLEIIDDLGEERVSLYKHGDFVDLCRGPHLPSTGYVKAFKLTSVAGAYWRGDETKPMLQRIYGTAFASEKDLKKYLSRLEEAKKRDHRKLGQQLDLFSFSEEAGPGMPIFHPKGALVRTILEDFEVREHLKRGYEIVRGPRLLRQELWKRSGHYDNYRENMYFTEIDGQVYGLKPMNCLSHMLIYKSKLRSYRDLPIRYFELGTVNRHEKSGVLHGLLRVRQFTQDDAHIICRPDQLQEEIVGVLKFVHDVMSIFGFEYELEISTRPEKSIGSDEDWDRATSALTNALEFLGLEYDICPGEGAFYGPKIDVKLKDALGRKWQCSTIQCDFTLPERFDLFYVGEDGEKHRPVMLHRVILGAIERFMGVLIEHYAGAFPTWLAPVQAKILTVTEAHNEYARKCYDILRNSGLRIEMDLRNEKLGYKVREAQLEKVPYVLVVGEKEIEAKGVNVRLRGGKNIGFKTLEEVIELIYHDMDEPFKQGGMSYRYLY
ncbi:threonyl-tRNA synthetase [Desulfonauticus submarinus]|uniref:Threonine--tRNA ligase n=1 Tax=Desulfonauticus submarinus TaxID=206665 RepID=A0A1H0BJX0_9BACT|nr:threonine--tRNA ligase [Desulfonauticus submarinus]SDN45946.1 threonyl-tRNA synthetase [Desulfonauticus submarinus]